MLSISRYIKEWELKNPTEIIPGRGDMNLEREALARGTTTLAHPPRPSQFFFQTGSDSQGRAGNRL